MSVLLFSIATGIAMYYLIQLTYITSGSQGMPTTLLLQANTYTLALTSLLPNTDYTIMLCASTSVGCGPATVISNKTDACKLTSAICTLYFLANLTHHSEHALC